MQINSEIKSKYRDSSLRSEWEVVVVGTTATAMGKGKSEFQQLRMGIQQVVLRGGVEAMGGGCDTE